MYVNICQQIYLKVDRIYHSIKTKNTETNLTEDVKCLNMEGWNLSLSLPGSGFNSWWGTKIPQFHSVSPQNIHEKLKSVYWDKEKLSKCVDIPYLLFGSHNIIMKN